MAGERRIVRDRIAILVCILGLLATSGAAVYYRNLAAGLDGKLRALQDARVAVPSADRVVDGGGEQEPGRAAGMPQSGGLDGAKPDSAAKNAGIGTDLPSGPPAAPAVDNRLAGRRPGDQSTPWRRSADWMAFFKTNDPVRYEAFQQRRREAQARMENAYAGATNWFMDRDTWNMSETDLEDYNRMMTLLEDTRALSLQLQSGVPREDRWQTMFAVRSNLVALAPLLENEKNRELYDLCVTMGQERKNAELMVGYINQVISNTALHTIFPPMPMGGGGGHMGGRSPGREDRREPGHL